MKYRSKDARSAAFEDDVARLKYLAQSTAPGGLLDDDEWTEDHEADVQSLISRHCPSLAPLENGDNEEEEELSDGEEMEQDKETLRAVAHQQLRREALARVLDERGSLYCGNSPVSLQSFGISLTAKEVLHDGGVVQEGALVQVHWKPCVRGVYGGSALHWAVLGRSQESLAYIIESGADTSLGLSEGEAASTSVKITPMDLAKANGSHQCLHLMEAAAKKRDENLEKEKETLKEIEDRMQNRIKRKELKRLEREKAAEAEAENEEEEDQE